MYVFDQGVGGQNLAAARRRRPERGVVADSDRARSLGPERIAARPVQQPAQPVDQAKFAKLRNCQVRVVVGGPSGHASPWMLPRAAERQSWRCLARARSNCTHDFTQALVRLPPFAGLGCYDVAT